MTILLEPIKQEFGASYTAMGLLAGFAFAAALTTASLLSVLMGGLLYWRSASAYAAEIRGREAAVS